MRNHNTTRRNKRKTQARGRTTPKSPRQRTGPSKNPSTRTNKRENRGKPERQNRKSVAKTRKKIVRIPTPEGTRGVTIRVSQRSRQASTLGKYWNAVHHYLQTGDASRLKTFRGKYITDVKRVRHRLLTDPDELDRLGSAGVLSFESLYARSA